MKSLPIFKNKNWHCYYLCSYISLYFILDVVRNTYKRLPSFNPFQLSVALHIETSYLICNVSQMTGFYMKCNIGLKWVNPFQTNFLFLYPLKSLGV